MFAKLSIHRVSFVALAALLAAGTASAQPKSDLLSNVYAGANLGLYNKYDLRCDNGVKCDKTASAGGKVYAGYMFDERYGVEAVGFGMKSGVGSIKNKDNSYSPGSVNLRGIGLTGVLAFGEGPFTFKGRLGAAYTKGKSYSAATGRSESKSSLQPLIGAGVSYAFSKEISLNADWDRISGKYNGGNAKTNADMLSVGVSYKF
ncbi:porin family protein [Roseateles sp. DAIF2]|uniref:outer membrane beta-barrel protein n=1 Tax=Roseateles sp. DAIF2 TaxID=2714952 RepID=UPI0018A2E254|nr:outer membrane beta-barrel protein [Roseateles sp. DAIF2]QPF73214.1 porin family protein [Roseateles sp. DAIF2]